MAGFAVRGGLGLQLGVLAITLSAPAAAFAAPSGLAGAKGRQREAWSGSALSSDSLEQLRRARADADAYTGQPYLTKSEEAERSALLRRLDLEIELLEDVLAGKLVLDAEGYCERLRQDLPPCRFHVADILVDIARRLDEPERAQRLLRAVVPLLAKARATPYGQRPRGLPLEALTERFEAANTELTSGLLRVAVARETSMFVATSTTYAVIEVSGHGRTRWCAAVEAKRRLEDRGVAKDRILVSASPPASATPDDPSVHIRAAERYERVVDAEDNCSGDASVGLSNLVRGEVEARAWSNPILAAKEQATLEAEAPAAARTALQLVSRYELLAAARIVSQYTHLGERAPEIGAVREKIQEACELLGKKRSVPQSMSMDDLRVCAVSPAIAEDLLTAVMLDCRCGDEFETRACETRAREAKQKLDDLTFLAVPMQGRVEVGTYDFDRKRIEVSIPPRLLRKEVATRDCDSSTPPACEDYGTYPWSSDEPNVVVLELGGKKSRGWRRHLDHPLEGAREFKEALQQAHGLAIVRVTRHRIEEATDERAARGRQLTLDRLKQTRQRLRRPTTDNKRELAIAETCAKATRTTYKRAVVELELLRLELNANGEKVASVP